MHLGLGVDGFQVQLLVSVAPESLAIRKYVKVYSISGLISKGLQSQL